MRGRLSIAILVPLQKPPRAASSWRPLFRPCARGGFWWRVQLRTVDGIIGYEPRLDFFHMLSGSLQPLTYSLFFDPFDAMDRGPARAIGQHREAVQDGLWCMMAAVKDGPFRSANVFLHVLHW